MYFLQPNNPYNFHKNPMKSVLSLLLTHLYANNETNKYLYKSLFMQRNTNIYNILTTPNQFTEKPATKEVNCRVNANFVRTGQEDD